MARRARADLDDVLSLGLEREVLIERRHTVDLGNADAERIGNEREVLLTEVVVRRLHVL